MNSENIGQPHGNPSFCGLTSVALIILLSGLCAIAAPAQEVAALSQPYVWKNVKVGGGGFIPGFVFNTKQPGLAYCRTDIGSSYKWDNQAKKWIPLTDWCGVGNLHGSESIATDPIDPNRLYIAAGMGPGQPAAILRSTNQGATFQVVDVPFRMGGNSAGRGIGERLAIDPNDNDILYFGSRSAGLWVSRDAALTWNQVTNFPSTGDAGGGGGRGGGTGLSFVIFDAGTGTLGKPTGAIYVGSTERGDAHLYRSSDAGLTWAAVAGQPTNFVPIHAAFDSAGTLYLVYDNGTIPDNANDGAVWKFDPKQGTWTDITPVKAPDRIPGGYGGIGIDRQHPGTAVVATYHRRDTAHGGDDDERIYRTTDGGQSWNDITPKSHRDPSASPYLAWAGAYDATAKNPEPSAGWWIAAVAIDPFDSNHVCYTTGATIWNSTDINNADSGGDTHWSTWTEGIEETAILSLISPPSGAHLISGFGDICGFVHDDLDTSPPHPFLHPLFANMSSLDFAEKNPKVVIRMGTVPFHPPREGTMAYSLDGGYNWKPFTLGAAAVGGGGRGGGGGGGQVILSADGSVFMSTAGTPRISRDMGLTWTNVEGLPQGVRPIADRSNPSKFYALNQAEHTLYFSTDGGATFTNAEVSGLPEASGAGGGFVNGGGGRGGGGGYRLIAVPDREGDLWLVSQRELYHSTDGGMNFKQTPNPPAIGGFTFGKAAPNRDYPAIFIYVTAGRNPGIFRSDDTGSSWVRVNDDQHQWGNRFECIAGDPRIYGRVYVGTNGRGIFYGDIAN